MNKLSGLVRGFLRRVTNDALDWLDNPPALRLRPDAGDAEIVDAARRVFDALADANAADMPDGCEVVAMLQIALKIVDGVLLSDDDRWLLDKQGYRGVATLQKVRHA